MSRIPNVWRSPVTVGHMQDKTTPFDCSFQDLYPQRKQISMDFPFNYTCHVSDFTLLRA